MMEKARRFMQGRYGVDELSKFLMFLSIGMIFLGGITGNGLLNMLSVVFIGIAYMRLLSRNYYKCSTQNQKYLKLRYKVMGRWSGLLARFRERKIYRFYSCPQCSQKVRIPRGKGKVRITCPKCSTEFSEKS